MNRIALTYSNEYPLPTLTFTPDIENILDTGAPGGGILDGGQNFFYPVVFYQILNKQSNSAVTKRGRLVKHTINKRRQHNIKISSDEIKAYTSQNGIQNNFKLSHLIDFFNADYQYLAYESIAWTDYIPVVINNDDFKPDYIRNNLRFPEVSFTLLEVNSYG